MSETPVGREYRLLPVIMAMELAVLGPPAVLVWLLFGRWALFGFLTLLGLVAIGCLWRYRRRRAVLRQCQRAGVPLLSWFASAQPGSGRALLAARCALADAESQHLCLDAPEALVGYYSSIGFQVGSPVVAVGRGRLVYMERAPTLH